MKQANRDRKAKDKNESFKKKREWHKIFKGYKEAKISIAQIKPTLEEIKENQMSNKTNISEAHTKDRNDMST